MENTQNFEIKDIDIVYRKFSKEDFSEPEFTVEIYRPPKYNPTSNSSFFFVTNIVIIFYKKEGVKKASQNCKAL